jgi:hypothetical protein
MTTIETVEEAVSVLNERKWRGCEYAAGDRIVYWRDPAGSNQWHETLNPIDVIAIAQSLLDRGEIAELKQQLRDASDYVICTYCGEKTPKIEPFGREAIAEIIADHLPRCPTHPLHAWLDNQRERCAECRYNAWAIAAEDGEVLYCTVCDARSRANDFAAERNESREQLKQAVERLTALRLTARPFVEVAREIQSEAYPVLIGWSRKNKTLTIDPTECKALITAYDGTGER